MRSHFCPRNSRRRFLSKALAGRQWIIAAMTFAPVAQRTECRFAEPEIEVRFLAGAEVMAGAKGPTCPVVILQGYTIGVPAEGRS